MLRKLNRELADLEMSGLIDSLLDAMEKNLDAFVESSQNLDLTRTLEQLSEIFEMVSKKVALQNVHKVTDRGSFDKLESSLHKCAEMCARILELEENTIAVVNLADLVKKYEETRRSALQKQKLIDTVQRNETHRLFKFLSEMYAEREKGEGTEWRRWSPLATKPRNTLINEYLCFVLTHPILFELKCPLGLTRAYVVLRNDAVASRHGALASHSIFPESSGDIQPAPCLYRQYNGTYRRNMFAPSRRRTWRC
ncbi:hypothetical protein GEV33_000859 [Tenebrio molitor]|uniref:Uncharacterized protein n=1 Tax=Tenebrio molitor TaxID=7067 RepID=A0A8J6LKJ4_TENMO|nr:hypothetical protein GEV33_000859 [Tenebrio molitor]